MTTRPTKTSSEGPKTKAETSAEGAAAGGPPLPEPGACQSTTQYGRPCQKPTQPGRDVCWSHDPDNAARRVRNARAGGVAAHSPGTLEIAELKDELKALARDVKEGRVTPAIGTVLNQICNTIIRAVEQERKVRELDDLEARLAALEGRRDGAPRAAA
jgi:hypothetical protein